MFCCVAFVLVDGRPAGDTLVSLFLVFSFGVWCVFNLVLLHFLSLFFLFVVWLHCFGSLSFLKNVMGWEQLGISLCHCFLCFCFMVLLLNTCHCYSRFLIETTSMQELLCDCIVALPLFWLLVVLAIIISWNELVRCLCHDFWCFPLVESISKTSCCFFCGLTQEVV